ncbi:hypothetical protein LguiB_012625 [Lonicera macranthoides]
MENNYFNRPSTITGPPSQSLRRRRSTIQVNHGPTPAMPPLPLPNPTVQQRCILSDSTNTKTTPLPSAKQRSNIASTSGTKSIAVQGSTMEPTSVMPTNLTIYGHVDQQLDSTVRTLRKQNVGIVIHDDAEMYRILQELEALTTYNDKGKRKGKGKENQNPSTHVGDKGNSATRSVIAQRARRENERIERALTNTTQSLQPKLFPGLNPRRSQHCNVEHDRKRARFSQDVSFSLPTNYQFLPLLQKCHSNDSGLHTLAVNLFEAVFRLDRHTNSPKNVVQPSIETEDMRSHIQSLPETGMMQLLSITKFIVRTEEIYVRTGLRWPGYLDIDSSTFCRLMLRMFKAVRDDRG